MIETIYEELRGIGVVRSSDDFSSSWLGKERSYMRCLRAKSDSRRLPQFCCHSVKVPW